MKRYAQALLAIVLLALAVGILWYAEGNDPFFHLRSGAVSPTSAVERTIQAAIDDDVAAWRAVAKATPGAFRHEHGIVSLDSGHVVSFDSTSVPIAECIVTYPEGGQATAIFVFGVQRNAHGGWVVEGWHQSP